MSTVKGLNTNKSIVYLRKNPPSSQQKFAQNNQMMSQNSYFSNEIQQQQNKRAQQMSDQALQFDQGEQDNLNFNKAFNQKYSTNSRTQVDRYEKANKRSQNREQEVLSATNMSQPQQQTHNKMNIKVRQKLSQISTPFIHNDCDDDEENDENMQQRYQTNNVNEFQEGQIHCQQQDPNNGNFKDKTKNKKTKNYINDNKGNEVERNENNQKPLIGIVVLSNNTNEKIQEPLLKHVYFIVISQKEGEILDHYEFTVSSLEDEQQDMQDHFQVISRKIDFYQRNSQESFIIAYASKKVKTFLKQFHLKFLDHEINKEAIFLNQIIPDNYKLSNNDFSIEALTEDFKLIEDVILQEKTRILSYFNSQYSTNLVQIILKLNGQGLFITDWLSQGWRERNRFMTNLVEIVKTLKTNKKHVPHTSQESQNNEVKNDVKLQDVNDQKEIMTNENSYQLSQQQAQSNEQQQEIDTKVEDVKEINQSINDCVGRKQVDLSPKSFNYIQLQQSFIKPNDNNSALLFIKQESEQLNINCQTENNNNKQTTNSNIQSPDQGETSSQNFIQQPITQTNQSTISNNDLNLKQNLNISQSSLSQNQDSKIEPQTSQNEHLSQNQNQISHNETQQKNQDKQEESLEIQQNPKFKQQEIQQQLKDKNLEANLNGLLKEQYNLNAQSIDSQLYSNTNLNDIINTTENTSNKKSNQLSQVQQNQQEYIQQNNESNQLNQTSQNQQSFVQQNEISNVLSSSVNSQNKINQLGLQRIEQANLKSSGNKLDSILLKKQEEINASNLLSQIQRNEQNQHSLMNQTPLQKQTNMYQRNEKSNSNLFDNYESYKKQLNFGDVNSQNSQVRNFNQQSQNREEIIVNDNFDFDIITEIKKEIQATDELKKSNNELLQTIESQNKSQEQFFQTFSQQQTYLLENLKSKQRTFFDIFAKFNEETEQMITNQEKQLGQFQCDVIQSRQKQNDFISIEMQKSEDRITIHSRQLENLLSRVSAQEEIKQIEFQQQQQALLLASQLLVDCSQALLVKNPMSISQIRENMHQSVNQSNQQSFINHSNSQSNIYAVQIGQNANHQELLSRQKNIHDSQKYVTSDYEQVEKEVAQISSVKQCKSQKDSLLSSSSFQSDQQNASNQSKDINNNQIVNPNEQNPTQNYQRYENIITLTTEVQCIDQNSYNKNTYEQEDTLELQQSTIKQNNTNHAIQQKTDNVDNAIKVESTPTPQIQQQIIKTHQYIEKDKQITEEIPIKAATEYRSVTISNGSVKQDSENFILNQQEINLSDNHCQKMNEQNSSASNLQQGNSSVSNLNNQNIHKSAVSDQLYQNESKYSNSNTSEHKSFVSNQNKNTFLVSNQNENKSYVSNINSIKPNQCNDQPLNEKEKADFNETKLNEQILLIPDQSVLKVTNDEVGQHNNLKEIQQQSTNKNNLEQPIIQVAQQKPVNKIIYEQSINNGTELSTKNINEKQKNKMNYQPAKNTKQKQKKNVNDQSSQNTNLFQRNNVNDQFIKNINQQQKSTTNDQPIKILHQYSTNNNSQQQKKNISVQYVNNVNQKSTNNNNINQQSTNTTNEDQSAQKMREQTTKDIHKQQDQLQVASISQSVQSDQEGVIIPTNYQDIVVNPSLIETKSNLDLYNGQKDDVLVDTSLMQSKQSSNEEHLKPSSTIQSSSIVGSIDNIGEENISQPKKKRELLLKQLLKQKVQPFYYNPQQSNQSTKSFSDQTQQEAQNSLRIFGFQQETNQVQSNQNLEQSSLSINQHNFSHFPSSDLFFSNKKQHLFQGQQESTSYHPPSDIIKNLDFFKSQSIKNRQDKPKRQQQQLNEIKNNKLENNKNEKQHDYSIQLAGSVSQYNQQNTLSASAQTKNLQQFIEEQQKRKGDSTKDQHESYQSSCNNSQIIQKLDNSVLHSELFEQPKKSIFEGNSFMQAIYQQAQETQLRMQQFNQDNNTSSTQINQDLKKETNKTQNDKLNNNGEQSNSNSNNLLQNNNNQQEKIYSPEINQKKQEMHSNKQEIKQNNNVINQNKQVIIQGQNKKNNKQFHSSPSDQDEYKNNDSMNNIQKQEKRPNQSNNIDPLVFNQLIQNELEHTTNQDNVPDSQSKISDIYPHDIQDNENYGTDDDEVSEIPKNNYQDCESSDKDLEDYDDQDQIMKQNNCTPYSESENKISRSIQEQEHNCNNKQDRLKQENLQDIDNTFSQDQVLLQKQSYQILNNPSSYSHQNKQYCGQIASSNQIDTVKVNHFNQINQQVLSKSSSQQDSNMINLSNNQKEHKSLNSYINHNNINYNNNYNNNNNYYNKNNNYHNKNNYSNRNNKYASYSTERNYQSNKSPLLHHSNYRQIHDNHEKNHQQQQQQQHQHQQYNNNTHQERSQSSQTPYRRIGAVQYVKKNSHIIQRQKLESYSAVYDTPTQQGIIDETNDRTNLWDQDLKIEEEKLNSSIVSKAATELEYNNIYELLKPKQRMSPKEINHALQKNSEEVSRQLQQWKVEEDQAIVQNNNNLNGNSNKINNQNTHENSSNSSVNSVNKLKNDLKIKKKQNKSTVQMLIVMKFETNYNSEITEIKAIIVNTDRHQTIDTFYLFIKPECCEQQNEQYKYIDKQMNNGKQAKQMEIVLAKLCNFLKPYLDNYKCCILYESDFDAQLLHTEFLKKQIIPSPYEFSIFYTCVLLTDIFPPSMHNTNQPIKSLQQAIISLDLKSDKQKSKNLEEIRNLARVVIVLLQKGVTISSKEVKLAFVFDHLEKQVQNFLNLCTDSFDKSQYFFILKFQHGKFQSYNELNSSAMKIQILQKTSGFSFNHFIDQYGFYYDFYRSEISAFHFYFQSYLNALKIYPNQITLFVIDEDNLLASQVIELMFPINGKKKPLKVVLIKQVENYIEFNMDSLIQKYNFGFDFSQLFSVLSCLNQPINSVYQVQQQEKYSQQ